jgi:hypothetical protein
LVSGKKVVRHVLDSQLAFVKEMNEWTGTDIVFEISKKGERTELHFTHVGLTPVFACYSNCSGAWSFYINDSLFSLITTGKGRPAQEREQGKD